MRKLLLSVILLLLSIAGFGQNVLKYIVTEDWVNNNWRNEQRTTYNYDANGFVINELQQQWDTTANDWVNYYQSNYTNTAAGVHQLYIYQMWDKPSGSWKTAMRGTNTYTSTGKMQSFISEGWVNNAWINSQKFSYTYDANDHVTKMLSQYWDNTNAVWYDIDQYNYTNNSNGDPLQGLMQNWNTNTSLWTNFWKYNYSYNGANQMLTQKLQNWMVNSWVNLDSMTNTYNTSGVLTQRFFSTWVDTANNWRDAGKTDYTYNINGTMHQYIEQRWHPLVSTTWFNDNRVTYYYTFPAGIAQINKPVITIFPNPATNQINIALADNSPASVSLTDIHGRPIATQITSTGNTTMELNNLPAGTYLLRIIQGGETTIKPFVKQ